jgi:mono/diheme cytochrome c family protein
MRYTPIRELLVRLPGPGALLGVVAVGLGVRWMLRKRSRRREASHALTPLAHSHALVPFVEPGPPAVAGTQTFHTSAALRNWRWISPMIVVLAIVASAGAMTYREGWVEHRIDTATGGVGGRAVPIMRANGCGGCHTIAGVPGAEGLVGPRLDASLSSRIYLAGAVPNDRQNMIRWLRSSRELVPHTAMPSTGMSEQDARDVAAYLYALR